MVEADLPGVLYVTSPLATDTKSASLYELARRRHDITVVADHPRHVALSTKCPRKAASRFRCWPTSTLAIIEPEPQPWKGQ